MRMEPEGCWGCGAWLEVEVVVVTVGCVTVVELGPWVVMAASPWPAGVLVVVAAVPWGPCVVVVVVVVETVDDA
jgi:hypothetical protein